MRRLPLLSLLLFSAPLFAADSDAERLKAALGKAFPDVSVQGVRSSPVAGVYEVVLGNNQVIYLSGDGRYAFTGDLLDLQARVNLSAQQRGKAILAAADALGADKMIVIGPKSPRHTMTVFTDVDCPYCAKFHLEVPELNRQGVQVRYVFFPRAGLESDSYRRSVAVWCAKDRAEAIGSAKAGRQIPMKTCDNPVAEHYRLSQTLRLQGTPMLVLDDGTLIEGYAPARDILGMLQKAAGAGR